MIRNTKATDIVQLSEKLRDEDREEINELLALDPSAAMFQGFMTADEHITGLADDGSVVLVAGVSPDGTGAGTVWMLCVEDMRPHAKALLKEGRAWVNKISKRYTRIHNVVHEKNLHRRTLLHHLGFQFGSPIKDYGPNSATVIPFERTQ